MGIHVLLCSLFWQKLEIMSHLEKKIEYVEEEKQRLECRLKNTELELKETQTSLEQSNSKRRVSQFLLPYTDCLLECLNKYSLYLPNHFKQLQLIQQHLF